MDLLVKYIYIISNTICMIEKYTKDTELNEAKPEQKITVRDFRGEHNRRHELRIVKTKEKKLRPLCLTMSFTMGSQVVTRIFEIFCYSTFGESKLPIL